MSFQTTTHGSRMPESLPLHIAMIGTGAIARLHLPAFLNRPDAVHLSRICELNSEAAANFARQLHTHPIGLSVKAQKKVVGMVL